MKSLVILLILNSFSFILYFIDKQKAIHHKRRISERTLLLSAFLFASLGAILSMLIFKHKTKKLKFIIAVPLFLVLHIFILFLLSNKFSLFAFL